MQKAKFLNVAITLFFAGFLIFAVVFVTHLAWRALLLANPQLAVALVTAGTTIIVATTTVMLGRYYERKKDIDAQFRSEKIRIYDQFLEELFKLFHSGTEPPGPDLTVFLREWQRKLVLWGGANVLQTYFRWVNRLKQPNPDAQTMFLMDDFFRALRSDIGQRSLGLERGAFVHLVLRYPGFFLEQARLNPAITLAELARMEKQRFGTS